MAIYIVRHGQTAWNASKKIQGRVDIELNEEGIRQAQEAREQLQNIKLDMIYSSPLMRAKQTAQIINEKHNLSIIEEPRIIERGFGDLEGTHISEMNFEDFWNPLKSENYPTCERPDWFFERVQSLIKELVEQHADKEILLVCHGGVSLPVYTFFNEVNLEGDLRKYMLNNGEIARYEIK